MLITVIDNVCYNHFLAMACKNRDNLVNLRHVGGGESPNDSVVGESLKRGTRLLKWADKHVLRTR